MEFCLVFMNRMRIHILHKDGGGFLCKSLSLPSPDFSGNEDGHSSPAHSTDSTGGKVRSFVKNVIFFGKTCISGAFVVY